MKGFDPGAIVSDPSLLFGKNGKGQILDQLISHVRRGDNCQLQGERRYGKTSTLVCLKKRIDVEYSESLICIYVNWKDYSLIHGNSNVYRLLISLTIQELTLKKKLNELESFKNCNLKPQQYWEDSFSDLSLYEDFRIQGIFEDLINCISERLRISFVYLFDEFEYLFKYNFESPQGFFKIRSISEKINDGIHPLTFIITGMRSWDQLTSDIGSPELNTIGVNIIYLCPLELVEFKNMWKYWLEKIEDQFKSDIYDPEEVFAYSGGIPFFAKVIGESMINENVDYGYNILKTHFTVLYDNLSPYELSCIKAFFNKDYSKDSSAIKNNLEARGILRKENDKYFINGKLLWKYFNERMGSPKNNFDEQEHELQVLADNIIQKIHNINADNKLLHQEYTFEITNDDGELYIDLKSKCSEKDDMIAFSAALYKTLFERTKRIRPLDRLPLEFRKRRKLVKLVEGLRHHFGGHLTTSANYHQHYGQFTKEEILISLLGTKLEPRKPEDFHNIQINILSQFNKYLGDLEKKIREN